MEFPLNLVSMGLVKIITEVGKTILNAECHGTILDQTWEFSKLD
jgi:hypothetical protein